MGASYAVISQDFAKVFIFELHSMIAKPKLTTLGAITLTMKLSSCTATRRTARGRR